MFVLAAVLIAILFYAAREWYRRYIPVRNIPCMPPQMMNGFTIVDVRDYNNRHDLSIDRSLNIPYSYLQKAFKDIRTEEIYLIAATKLERNMSIRFLKQKGISVKGYALTNEEECGKPAK
ncbi:sulfurtransferase [Bacillus sp. FJAT-42376]|uniref:sulfurtransferase n=1 Tax=Bacillus sp. FJAT-42376 TaxID=2014076 RepID=UPI000F4D3B04|nr:sulfurtransferase [Bacillus sp. FJAT-42376]AZB42568.1 sulfurtransferase [Bacillus sp. FJAT-42376]